jgi:rubredoxin
MSKEAKRTRFGKIEGTPIDMSDFWANRKKREQAELERKRLEAEQEKARIDEIKCPVCKSTDKIHHIKRQNNGIYGPGSSSWVTDDYLVCRGCGIHYDDVSKLK